MKMSGVNPTLDIYLGAQSIAKITVINEQLYWSYTSDWRKVGYAVSPHLPLNDEIPSLNVLRFLKNLLPEGKALDELVANYHLSKNNIIALVRELGLDTLVL
jgi:serine/threonine-protein kinase HipA